jgi:ABC-type multidrug transport system fused ATPase/permease subunit
MIMKKIFNKLFKKNVDPEAQSRITSDTLAHHRERIIAGGRRFKYPIQYVRHKLVFNTIIISVAVIIIMTIIGWWQLYPKQNTSQFMYRLTTVIPVPVASVDGQSVLYSDYLMLYLSQLQYIETKDQVDIKTEDGKRQTDYLKKQTIDKVIADAYAKKIAKKLNISVSDIEVESFIKAQRQYDNGEQSSRSYEAVLLDYYNWTPKEYRYIVKNKLLSQKVAYEIDDKAKSIVTSASSKIELDKAISLKSLSEELSSQNNIKIEYGISGLVSMFKQDGGLAVAASKLDKNSAPVVVKSTTGRGYYFVKLLDINDSKVNYEYIRIPLTKLQDDLQGVIDSGKVHKYIKL